MNDTNNLQPPIFLPGIRQQPPEQAGISGRIPRRQYQAPPTDRSIDPGALQAMLMQRLMSRNDGLPSERPGLHQNDSVATKSTSLFPGYTVYRCVDDDNKLMRAVGKTDQLGNTDQFIISEQVIQALILDENLTVIDLGGDNNTTRRIKVVPIKTPPMSSLGVIYVEEGAVNRSSGRSLAGTAKRVGNLLID